jgi:hypothetical protein
MSCYADNVEGRTLSSASTTDKKMTLEVCAQFAQTKNLQYFGIEYAGECWAGNTLASAAGALPESTCDMKCKGNANQTCGGPNALSLFQNSLFTQPGNPATVKVTGQSTEFAYQGCFTDGVSGRALGGSAAYYTSSNQMSVEMCVSACYTNGFSYAGVEYAGECFCNNAGVINGGALAAGGDADCSMLCSGNKTQYCGGPNRLNVYQLKSSKFRRQLY